MPGSHFHQLSDIVSILVATKPKSILDVGVGFGKYGVLAREYLDLWEGEGKEKGAYRTWRVRLEGVEAYPSYLTPLHDFIYDKIHIGDAREVVPSLTGVYDLALLIDVLEHMGREHGSALLQALRAKARNVLVSTPKDIGHQHALFGNEFERHVFQWEEKHLNGFSDLAVIPHDVSLIFYMGEDVERVRTLLKKRLRADQRKSIRTLLPFLVGPYTRVKRMFTHGHP